MVSNAPDGSRTAFHLWPVHEHRGRPSGITAIALQQAAGKLLLGFSDGQLEEHRIIPPPASPTSTSTTAAAARDSVAPRLALAARKQVGKRPVTAIATCEAASRLAVLCDGLLMLLDADTLEGQLLPGIKANPSPDHIDVSSSLTLRILVSGNSSLMEVLVVKDTSCHVSSPYHINFPIAVEAISSIPSLEW